MGKLKMEILGRAVRDAEVKKSQSGKDYAVFSVAANLGTKEGKEDDVSFVECLIFGETISKAAGTWIKKGEHIWAVGKPEADSYVSKDGEVKSSLKMFVDEWEVLLGSKPAAGEKAEKTK